MKKSQHGCTQWTLRQLIYQLVYSVAHGDGVHLKIVRFGYFATYNEGAAIEFHDCFVSIAKYINRSIQFWQHVKYILVAILNQYKCNSSSDILHVVNTIIVVNYMICIKGPFVSWTFISKSLVIDKFHCYKGQICTYCII